MQKVVLLHVFLLGLASGAEFLQNSDFESPPSNLPENTTTPIVLLNQENNTIRGWSFDGTVSYVTSSEQSMTLPGNNGHAIQLGPDGKINQTFTSSSDYMYYILTFVLVPGGKNCSLNADLVISAPDSRGEFSLKQNYSLESWVTYGQLLGDWRDAEPINLVIQSQAAESDMDSPCWPVVDKLLLKSIPGLVKGNDNELLNGGFETGPDFLAGSNEGILLDPATSPIQSPLREWAILGTIKYINSRNYYVPEGNAAVELISGNTSGIQIAATLEQDSMYTLEFMLGDANDSCVGGLKVRAQAGSSIQNYTLQSKGTGSAEKFSLSFKADSSTTTISFVSYAASQTKDGVLCGPVIDNVVLRASFGLKLAIRWRIILSSWLLVAILVF